MSDPRPEISFGRVVHRKPCPTECMDGHYVVCRHGAGCNCDCPGQEVECETCEGVGEIVDEDCDCEECVLLFVKLEEHRNAERH